MKAYPYLFQNTRIGSMNVPNRVIMAPLTRLRSELPGDIPTDLMAEYYAQRASAGFIITEATQVSAQAKGYQGAPGLHSDAQERAWAKITQAVHAQGGRIGVQLWHTGLISHQSLQPDLQAPISASATQDLVSRTSLQDSAGQVYRVATTPSRAASSADIQQVIADFAAATRRARAAGFDFVEIHGAHGYLLHQFLVAAINQRNDAYGGSRENRARLLLDVVDACVAAWDAEHISIRISPIGKFNGMPGDFGAEDTLWLVDELNQRGLMYLHISEPDYAGAASLSDAYRVEIRRRFKQAIIGAGLYTAAKANRLIEAGLIDAAAFGRDFIANPDLPERFACGAELNPYRGVFAYGGGAVGYTDYPFLEAQCEGAVND